MRILVTGGAGFIGSNLVEHLLNLNEVETVRVLDNLATGNPDNLAACTSNPKFQFMEGDIRDFETCLRATDGMDLVSHQAALGSVPRSINDPLTTNNVNITGTLNIFTAAKENKIIITHGTDTMAETAKVLSEKTKNKTIVLTGAMIPYKFGSSDGLFNLGSALAFVQTLPPGIYIAMNGKYFTAGNVRKNKQTGMFEESIKPA